MVDGILVIAGDEKVRNDQNAVNIDQKINQNGVMAEYEQRIVCRRTNKTKCDKGRAKACVPCTRRLFGP